MSTISSEVRPQAMFIPSDAPIFRETPVPPAPAGGAVDGIEVQYMKWTPADRRSDNVIDCRGQRDCSAAEKRQAEKVRQQEEKVKREGQDKGSPDGGAPDANPQR